MADEDLVKDIVCGMTKTRQKMPFVVIYAGKKYYFCSLQDKQIFQAYPDRWVKEEE